MKKPASVSPASLFRFLLFSLIFLSASKTGAVNTNYVTNRSPLYQVPYYALPLGSIKADGWLLKQLEAQRDGLGGHQEELFPEVGSSSAWLGGNGESYEQTPYYVRGLVPLAYILDDATLKQKAKRYIDWLLNNQLANGYLGNKILPDKNDWWPNMPMLEALCNYYEATEDARVLPALEKYFIWQKNYTTAGIGFWATARAQDNAFAVIFTYNRINNPELLDAFDFIRARTQNWISSFNNGQFGDGHGINVGTGLKTGPVFYQRSGKTTDRDSYTKGFAALLEKHGRVDYMFNGTEFVSGKSSTQSTEFCSLSETIFSHSFGFRAIGDACIGDYVEKVAFNTIPGGLTPGCLQHQYYISTNHVQSKVGNLGYKENWDHAMAPAWWSGQPKCCCHNFARAWPAFVQFSWMATEDNGLIAYTYAPMKVTAKVGDSVSVTIVEDTRYPFEEQIRLTLTVGKPVAFPLKLRIPEWCSNPGITVNGVAQTGAMAPKTFYTISRTWNTDDKVVIDFPMKLKASKWINNSIALEYGPLVFSLKIKEKWQMKVSKVVSGIDFSRYEVFPELPWNYGLLLDPDLPEKYVTINRRAMPGNPFIQDSTPITLTTRGKQISTWTLSTTTVLANEVPTSPFTSSAQAENVTLVPFGAERLRVTYLPWTKDGAEVVGTLPSEPQRQTYNQSYRRLNRNVFLFEGENGSVGADVRIFNLRGQEIAGAVTGRRSSSGFRVSITEKMLPQGSYLLRLNYAAGKQEILFVY